MKYELSANEAKFSHTNRMVMKSFRDDWRKAYVISNSFGMGDPLAYRFEEAGRTAEGGGLPAVFLAGITRP